MSAFAAMLLVLSMPQSSSTELLVFGSPRCGACVEMAPVVEQLSRMGYPVRKIDVSRSPEWANRFRISSVPAYVVVRDGEVANQIVGKTSLSNLQQLLHSAGFNPQQQQYQQQQQLQQQAQQQMQQASLVQQSLENGANQLVSTAASFQQQAGPSQDRSGSIGTSATRSRNLISRGAIGQPSSATSFTSEALLAPARQAAMEATVRLRVTDQNGAAVGTGTIIHQRGSDALVLTCGHLFEESKGNVQIEVEYGFGGQRDIVAGGLLKYEYESHDVGLVVFQPRQPVSVAQVALPKYQPIAEDALFSIGCDHGADPSFRQTNLVNITTYGRENLVAKYDTSGRPALGRSGGGLFTAGGQLIGVCNFAAEEVDEGTYAGMQSIYYLLDQVGLGQHFRDEGRIKNSPQINPRLLAQQDRQTTPSITTTNVSNPDTQSVSPDRRRVFPNGNQARTGLNDQRAAPQRQVNLPQQIIVLVPSATNPNQMESRVIQNPTPELLQALQQNGVQFQAPQAHHEIARAQGSPLQQRGGNQPMNRIGGATPRSSNSDWNSLQPPADGVEFRAQSPN